MCSLELFSIECVLYRKGTQKKLDSSKFDSGTHCHVARSLGLGHGSWLGHELYMYVRHDNIIILYAFDHVFFKTKGFIQPKGSRWVVITF
jgi:hypothetical protein